MMTKLKILFQIIRHLGVGWIAFRVFYKLKFLIRYYEWILPAGTWDRYPLKRFLSDPNLVLNCNYKEYRRNLDVRFFFESNEKETANEILKSFDATSTNPQSVAEEVSRGIFTYFSHQKMNIGFPPNWHSNPFNQQQIPSKRHWSRIDDFGYGDIKIIWEPSRFGFVYPLVRAYWRERNETYAECFWTLVEDWMDNNPPNQGANWKCGQEVAIRVMALCFGLYGFYDSPYTTPARVKKIVQLIAFSGERIEKNIHYAISQKNNHGMSEAMGLFTIGVLFPEFKASQKWKSHGKYWLELLAQRLIYKDGAFSQHSANYHRLMLHDYIWALRLGDLNQCQLNEKTKERIKKAFEFLYQIQDKLSGKIPCYGQNDGSLILALNNCDYQDFRPVIQTLNYYFYSTCCFERGPWDEDLFWLFNRTIYNNDVITTKQSNLSAQQGGCYTIRNSNGFTFIRCATFRHRPGHADLLHVDIWWQGINIAQDSGTFSYNAPPPWDNPLSQAFYHNTVTVNQRDQMERISKFLWLPWINDKVITINEENNGSQILWSGEHDGYHRLQPPVFHRRHVIMLGEEHWLVCDRLSSASEFKARLHWLICDQPHRLDEENGRLDMETSMGIYSIVINTLSGSSTVFILRADDKSPYGWRAPYYNSKEPSLSLIGDSTGKELLFVSAFGPSISDLKAGEGKVILKTHTREWECLIPD